MGWGDILFLLRPERDQGGAVAPVVPALLTHAAARACRSGPISPVPSIGGKFFSTGTCGWGHKPLSPGFRVHRNRRSISSCQGTIVEGEVI
jgi:hypothetical protein